MLSIRSQYLNALNIPEYLHVVKDTPQKVSIPLSIDCLVVELENQNSICIAGETQDFLFKMLSAIGLQQKNIICIKASPNTLLDQIANYHARTILLTHPQLTLNTSNVFSMLHPSEVLKDDKLKRDAWEVLKQVKVCLK
ncbi:hypothetical protein [uncultured Gammaproteobacteria bacterium]|uniref:hypothetical protein n=1 Tax=Bathymodiolus heckerae thiotrophic gill symbiont TaxID=1052212 RepID=UPI0010B792CE|nr:hypothetical protein [Bathymodiolus heckerae thiotrophic gill symbiont]CAC9602468.1 hypothetical protein [uncultured Gammaproteobacteria bacterium]CAC9952907.1 hypothetical protein [uncultured Gammaproteobacteria bacterium]CAC9965426.1 hypothetical protein [uncultured Gammaproteobacteria bacterium]SHN90202.1 hypothetical protein BHECKSOX_393 [Bathymodiolus heckerae thiotrophic gill symbiont]